MAEDVPILTAFLAGLASFLSPCTLPLVPVYLAHLAGVAIGDVGGPARGKVAGNAAAFVAGFGAVFVLLGVALGAAGAWVSTAELVAGNRLWLVRVGGALLVLLGLHQLGLVTLPFLGEERRLRVGGPRRAGRLGSSFLVGASFGAGWTPCVGAIYGVILTMAMSQADIGRATMLLTAYAGGLAVAFLAAGLVFGASPGLFRRVNARFRAITTVSGAVMLATGAVMLLGLYQDAFVELARLAEERGLEPWEPSL